MQFAAEAVTTYSVATDSSWSQQVTPDGTIYKEFFYTSGWQSGLSYQSESWSGGVRHKWTTTAWTQGDTNLSYQKNPRPYDISIYDQAGNRRRIDITYTSYSLPYEIREYAADGSSLLRRTYIDYNFNPAYIDRRIIGLRSAVHVVNENNQYVSKVTYEYDWDNATNPYLINQGAATQHDGANYSQSFIGGRGNLCAVRRWNVSAITDSNQAGRSNRGAKRKASSICEVEPDRLVAAVEKVCGIPREDFCGTGKNAPAIRAKELLILIGLQMGASMKLLSEIIGISPSALSRRHDAARRKLRDTPNTSKLASKIIQQYRSGEY